MGGAPTRMNTIHYLVFITQDDAILISFSREII